MNIDCTQRWRDRKPFFIQRDKLFNPRLLEVAKIDEKSAKDFILRTHYSNSFPSSRRRFGLFLRGNLIGAAIFSHPMSDAVLTNNFGGVARESLELGRFVIEDLPEAGFNCESWFFARCREVLRKEDFRGIVSFSDDLQRTDSKGNITFFGHLGIFYSSSGGVYTGRSLPTQIFLLPDGKVFSKRTISKIRNNESGAVYAAGILQSFGASELPDHPAERATWLKFWLGRLTRKVKHPGNHRYLFSLQKSIVLPKSKPYPKIKYNDLQLSLPI